MQESLDIMKAPSTYGWITYAWVLVLAGLGGFVNYMHKIRHGKARPWTIIEFIGELATSAFVGLLTFYLSQAAGFSSLITAALVGISGHMGSRALFLFEITLRRRFRFFEQDHKFPDE